jgi:hypothetical protein
MRTEEQMFNAVLTKQTRKNVMNPCSSQIRKDAPLTVFLSLVGPVLLGAAAIALHAGTPPPAAVQTAAPLPTLTVEAYVQKSSGIRRENHENEKKSACPMFRYA